MRQMKIQFKLPLEDLPKEIQHRGSTGYMSQRNKRQILSPKNLRSSAVIQNCDNALSNRNVFAQTQSKFKHVLSSMQDREKFMPAASHFSPRQIATTQNRSRKVIQSSIIQGTKTTQLTEENDGKTTRASCNLVPSSIGGKNREVLSAFNSIASPTTTKMSNKISPKEAIEDPQIFINKKIQQAAHKKGIPSSLIPIITERFVKRDQQNYIQNSPDGILSVSTKDLEKAFKHNIDHAQREGQTIKELRQTRRGLSDELITAVEKPSTLSKSPKLIQEILDQSRKTLANKIVIDYPRPLRIASTDGTVDEVRSVLRYNFIAHQEYNPILDSLKSRLLLKGVYSPNIDTKKSETTKNVNDFVKQNKNHRCENFTISDLYDADMVAKEKEKAIALEKKLMQTMKAPSFEQVENKLHLINLIKSNANRNQKEQKNKNKGELQETQAEPHKLTNDQNLRVFALIDQRDQTVSNKNLPLSSYVQQMENLLDQGFYVEYIENENKHNDASQQPAMSLTLETGGDNDQIKSIDEQITVPLKEEPKKEFSTLFKEKFKAFLQKKVQEMIDKENFGKKEHQKIKVKKEIHNIDQLFKDREFQTDKVLGPINLDQIKEFSSKFRELKKEEQQRANKKNSMKKDESITDLAFSYQNQDIATTQAASVDILNRSSVRNFNIRYPYQNQRSQMIMFVDTNDSVETQNKAPYTSRVHEIMQEQLISKSIQLDKMMNLYKMKTKSGKLKDKWTELENMKTNSKIVLLPKKMSSVDSQHFNSKISLPSTAAVKSRKFDILATQDSRQTVNDNLYQRNILDTNNSVDLDDQQQQDDNEAPYQVKYIGPSKEVLLDEIRKIRQKCNENSDEQRSGEDQRIKTQHKERLEMIWEKEDRLKKAIETYQDEQLIKSGASDRYQLCQEMLEEDLLQDNENFDNFLRPEQIKALRSEKMQMIKTSLHGRTKIWKPKRYEYPDHVRQIIISQKDEVRKRSLQEYLRKW